MILTRPATPVPRLRAAGDPAILSYGFRPFFLLGALYAAIAIPLWLATFYGVAHIPTAFTPRDWHVHEMLYGYLGAILTGFLLTSIPNWTGRLPVQGAPLLALVLAWLAARIAVAASAYIGAVTAAAVDLGFFVLVFAVCLREVVAGRNWRNLRVLAIILLFIIGDAAFHVEAIRFGAADYGIRGGFAAAVLLIALIGGRVIPSFTRNWLARENPGRLPAPFGRFDGGVIVASALVLVAWIAMPDRAEIGVAAIAIGGLHVWRLARWAGDRTLRDPLVLILHVAYVFVPLGFVLAGLAALGVAPASAGLHAWAGAIGTMTLAIMTRASLGHTGRALHANAGTIAIYLCIVAAGVARVCAALSLSWAWHDPLTLLAIAGAAWTAAFAGFVIVYGPVLTRPSQRAHSRHA